MEAKAESQVMSGLPECHLAPHTPPFLTHHVITLAHIMFKLAVTRLQSSMG